jgi:hypothetical protein
MKPFILNTGIAFLLLFMIGAGCEKENEYEVIALEYSKCPCDSEKSFVKKVTIDKILLFDTTKTSFSDMRELSLNGDKSRFVCYNPESNNAVFYSYTGITGEIGYICNFPEAAREWVISSEGIYLSYSADIFETCKEVGSIGGWTFFSDNILTSLKK